jgi:hypothetical protein
MLLHQSNQHQTQQQRKKHLGNMIAFAYVIAGALFGFMFPALVSCYLGRCVTVNGHAACVLAFVGGIGGHVLFTLLNN